MTIELNENEIDLLRHIILTKMRASAYSDVEAILNGLLSKIDGQKILNLEGL